MGTCVADTRWLRTLLFQRWLWRGEGLLGNEEYVCVFVRVCLCEFVCWCVCVSVCVCVCGCAYASSLEISNRLQVLWSDGSVLLLWWTRDVTRSIALQWSFRSACSEWTASIPSTYLHLEASDLFLFYVCIASIWLSTCIGLAHGCKRLVQKGCSGEDALSLLVSNLCQQFVVVCSVNSFWCDVLNL